MTAAQAQVVIQHRFIDDLTKCRAGGAAHGSTHERTKYGDGKAVHGCRRANSTQTDRSADCGTLGSARERIGDTEARTEGATELLGPILGLGFGRAAARAEDDASRGMRSLLLTRRRGSEGFRH